MIHNQYSMFWLWWLWINIPFESLLGMIIDRFPEFEVIFLDIDGVLNRTRAATHIRLDEDLMLLLKERKLSTFA